MDLMTDVNYCITSKYKKEDVQKLHGLLNSSWLIETAENDLDIFNGVAKNTPANSPFIALVMQQMFPPWATRSLADRAQGLASGQFQLPKGAGKEEFEKLLGVELTESLWDAEKEAARWLILPIMDYYGFEVGENVSSTIPKWRYTLEQAVLAGVNLLESYPDRNGTEFYWSIHSFLQGFLRSHLCRRCNPAIPCHISSFREAVLSLATELRNLGFSLMQTGSHIQNYVQRVGISAWYWKDGVSSLESRYWLVFELQYGPRQEDWHLKSFDAKTEWLEE